MSDRYSRSLATYVDYIADVPRSILCLRTARRSSTLNPHADLDSDPESVFLSVFLSIQPDVWYRGEPAKLERQVGGRCSLLTRLP